MIENLTLWNAYNIISPRGDCPLAFLKRSQDGSTEECPTTERSEVLLGRPILAWMIDYSRLRINVRSWHPGMTDHLVLQWRSKVNPLGQPFQRHANRSLLTYTNQLFPKMLMHWTCLRTPTTKLAALTNHACSLYNTNISPCINLIR